MSCNHSGNEELGKRIRTLTSLLYRLKVQKSPSKQPRDITPFLSHFATLLSYGGKDDQQAENDIAVTGSFVSPNEVRILVVSQNPHLPSAVKDISLKFVKTEKRPLEEVVNGPSDPPLIDHIADVWAALYAFTQVPRGPDYVVQLEALEVFFLSRSYRKFVSRFKEDNRLCNNRRLFDVIAEWQPDRPEISPKWVRPYTWLVKYKGLPSIKSRTVQGEVEWEFSDDTKKAWSEILAILLVEVDEAIKKTIEARTMIGKEGQEAEREAMVILNRSCCMLSLFVNWKAGIVKSLLTETNMVASIDTRFVLMRGGELGVDETEEDDDIEFLQEPNESKGEQLYRYLNTVVGWHHAVDRFSHDAIIQKLLESVKIGFIEVPPSPSSVLTQIQISEAFFGRFPSMAHHRDVVLKTFEDHHSDTFSGCVHAEATLMGLINYYAPQRINAKRSVVAMDASHMWNFIEPMANAGRAVIAVSGKCCWCCDWLGQNLETRFKLPGTHGIVYPWNPPTVGISEAVLRRMEEELWEELLYPAVSDLISPPYSRESSEKISTDVGNKITPPWYTMEM